jgi:phosphatidate cytidylyltransferase
VADDKREGDELFEDLDKFFAPIRDVDWDEPEQTASQAPQEAHVEVHAPSEEPVPTAEDEGSEDEAWYDTGQIEPVEPEVKTESERVDDEELVVVEAEAAPGQGDLFEDEEERDEWPLDEEIEEGVVDEVPAPADVPTDADLEAAAEHFAGSLRGGEGYPTEPADVFGDEGTVGAELVVEPEDVEAELLADLREPEPGQRTVVVGGEGTSGPSWQDVSTVEIGADVERRGPNVGERDVPAAFMTGIVLAGVALAALWLGTAAFAVVASLAVLIAQGELFGVMVKHHHQPATAVGLVSGGLMMVGAYTAGESATPAMFALGVVATFLWFMTVPVAHRKSVLSNIGMTVLNMAWIPLLAGYLIAVLKFDDGRALVVALVGLTFIFDTAAFLVGSVWGGSFFQRPLAPSISPKKSLEGLIGATLVTVVVSVALVPAFIDLFADRKVDALLLAIVVSVAATLGDLAESLVKRDLGVKDMGSVLPGHGGILDRIDSLLFVAPAAFLLFRVIFT